MDDSRTKVALTTWRNRISPVFDAAQMLTIAEIENGRVCGKSFETLYAELPFIRAARLSEWGVQVLICGAISAEFAGLIEMYGIQIIPFVTGTIREVLDAYLHGSLLLPSFRMPGFRRSRRIRYRGGRD